MYNFTQKTTSSQEEIRSDFLDDDKHETPFQVCQAISLDIVKEKCPHLVQLFDDKVFDIVWEAIGVGVEAALTVAGVEDSWQPLYRRTLAKMDD